MLCSEWSLVKNETHKITVIPLRCRCWSCDDCAPIRKWQLTKEAKRGKPNLFVTLTSRNRSHWTPAYAAQRLVLAWRTVRAEYMKKHGTKSLPFLAVFETTKSGWPHLHIIARCSWLDQRWLSTRMKQLHDSPIVDVRRVHGSKKVVAYVTKYLSKNPSRFEGTKRYWRSQDYLDPSRALLKLLRPREEPWTILKAHWKDYAKVWEKAGAQVQYGPTEAVIPTGVPP